jgi:hypothetical protein
MKPSEQDIENLLHRAPQPAPPAELKQQLSNQMNLSLNATSPYAFVTDQMPMSWWQRWWPALAPAAASAAFAVVLVVQQAEIRNLRATIHSLSNATTTEPAPTTTTTQPGNPPTHQVDRAAAEQEEIARLKERIKQLTAEIGQLEQTQKENEALRRQIAAPPTLSAEEMDALAKAKEKAMSIQCVNNLKQFGLAVRQWAIDNKDVFPPDTLSMSNELNTPKILVCPADTNRLAASNWTVFISANCSYEYLAPSASSFNLEPYRVLSRCPIHGHIGMCDGAVQGTRHPEWLVERDGKLFYQDPNQTPTPNR